MTYGTTGDSPGDVLVMDLQPSTAVTASGAYPWSVTITPSGGFGTTYSGTAYLDVSSASEGVMAGNGWTIAGVNRLISTTGGVEWKDGEGDGEFFASGMSGSFTSPAGDFGTLTQTMGGYTYVAKGGLYTDNFNSSGYETSKVTADGLTTTFTYSGSELTSIETPDCRFVSFTYDGSGNLQTAQMPSGTATLTHDGGGNLTGIQRPDGSLLTFTYDGDGQLTVEQTPDTTPTFAYDGHEMLESINGGLGNTPTVQPALSQGFGSNAANLSNAIAVVTNALGDATAATLDAAGQATQTEAPDGSLTEFTYDSNYDPPRLPTARLGDRTVIAALRRLLGPRNDAEVSGGVVAVAKARDVAQRRQHGLGHRHADARQGHQQLHALVGVPRDRQHLIEPRDLVGQLVEQTQLAVAHPRANLVQLDARSHARPSLLNRSTPGRMSRSANSACSRFLTAVCIATNAARRRVNERSRWVASSGCHTRGRKSQRSSWASTAASILSVLTLAWAMARVCTGLDTTTSATNGRGTRTTAQVLLVASRTTWVVPSRCRSANCVNSWAVRSKRWRCSTWPASSMTHASTTRLWTSKPQYFIMEALLARPGGRRSFVASAASLTHEVAWLAARARRHLPLRARSSTGWAVRGARL